MRRAYNYTIQALYLTRIDATYTWLEPRIFLNDDLNTRLAYALFFTDILFKVRTKLKMM